MSLYERSNGQKSMIWIYFLVNRDGQMGIDCGEKEKQTCSLPEKQAPVPFHRDNSDRHRASQCVYNFSEINDRYLKGNPLCGSLVFCFDTAVSGIIQAAATWSGPDVLLRL